MDFRRVAFGQLSARLPDTRSTTVKKKENTPLVPEIELKMKNRRPIDIITLNHPPTHAHNNTKPQLSREIESYAHAWGPTI